MTLFKYLPPIRADFFKTFRLRYSQPAVFNDPFEGKPFYPGIVPEEWMAQSYPRRFAKVLIEQYDSMDEGFKSGVSLHAFAFIFEHMRSEIYGIFEHVDRSFIPEINSTMNAVFTEKMGALSLSEVCDNLLMWGHYAESHKGFLIEFDAAHPIFDFKGGDDGQELWRLHRVTYAKERPQTYAIDLDIRAILLTKHESWKYEREWKHFRPLSSASEVFPNTPCPICLFDFPPETVRSVMLGAMMQNEVREEIKELIRSNSQLHHTELFQMQLDDRTYALNRIAC